MEKVGTLLDTGVFDVDRYFDIFVEYAKGGPENMIVRITVYNPGRTINFSIHFC